MKNFEQKCYDYLVKFVPAGKVITYGGLAKAVGSPKAAQAVGNAMHKNPNPPEVPCHRVIRSGGDIGEYLYGTDVKIDLLEQEGVKIIGNKVGKDYILQI